MYAFDAQKHRDCICNIIALFPLITEQMDNICSSEKYPDTCKQSKSKGIFL